MGNILFTKKRKTPGKPITNPEKLDNLVPLETQPMPPLDELNTMFDMLLEDLNIGSDKKELMKQFPPERKWMICQAQMKDRVSKDAETDYVQILDALKNNPSAELLSDLVVSLRSRPIRWISKFVEQDGLNLILAYLKNMSESSILYDHEELCIKCLKSLMNNKYGLSSVMSHPESLFVITLSLRSPSLRTRSLVLEILAASCLIPGGHKRVLEGLTRFASVSGERARFDTIVQCLCADVMSRGTRQEDKVERILELQIASLSFINSVICGGPGKELEFRCHMRCEFIKLGVDKVVERLSEIEHEALETQLAVYQDRMEADEAELGKKYDVSTVNKEDVSGMFGLMLDSVKNTRAQQTFQSLFQHMILIPANPIKRSKYLRLLDEICAQIVLQKENENPDPDVTKINIDVKTLITELIDADKLKEAEEKAKKQSERAVKAIKELDTQKDTFMKELSKMEQTVKDKTKKETEAVLENMAARKEIVRLEGILRERFGNSETALKQFNLGQFANKTTFELPPEVLKALAGGQPIGEAGVAPPAPGQGPPPPPGAGPPPPPPPGEAAAGGPPPPPPPPGGDAGGPPPPPPPPGPGGGPPPPPPPGFGGPPPPPGMGMPGMPVGPPAKKNKLSTKPLKPFQWTKINNNEIANTVWKELDDSPIHKKMDYSEFEELFGAYQKKEKEVSESKGNLHGGSTENMEQVAKVSLLDGKRAQTINILMRSLKLSGDELRRAITSCDFNALTPHILAELLKLTPTNDEIQILQPFEKDIDKLGAPERFIYELSKIKRYGEKVKSFFARSLFDEWCEDSKKQIKALAIGSKEIQNSKKFKDLLQLVLALGNYLNSGPRGGAYGFKLDSLIKVGEVRSGIENRRHTLLHYLVDLIDKKFPDIKGWQDDLKSMEAASKVEMPVLRSTLMLIKNGLKDTNSLLESLASDPKDPTDKFISTMTEWAKSNQKKFEQLDQAFKDAENSFGDICKLFGEDPKSIQPNEFFSKFHQFITAFQNAKLDNEQAIQRQIELEKKEKEKQDRAKTIATKKVAPKKDANGAPAGAAAVGEVGQKDGEIDDLISSIKSGKAFFNQGFAPQKRQRNQSNKMSKNAADAAVAAGDVLAGGSGSASTPKLSKDKSNSKLSDLAKKDSPGSVARLKEEAGTEQKKQNRLSFSKLRKSSLSSMDKTNAI